MQEVGGSIPPSSTRILAKGVGMMLRIGRFAVITGIIVTVLGIVAGFTALFMDADDYGKLFISLVPVGFVTTFAGLTMTLLIGSARK